MLSQSLSDIVKSEQCVGGQMWRYYNATLPLLHVVNKTLDFTSQCSNYLLLQCVLFKVGNC